MDLSGFLKDKDILVTGGCGSIGSEIVKQLLNYEVKRIRVFDNNESAQFYLQDRYASTGKIRSLMGDVRDKDRLKRAMKGVNIVFHCAALKHVPLCEYNPYEAVSTNVYGTQNVIDAAREEGVERFIAVSTDKAVNPVNTMGASKLLAEKLVMTASVGETKTLFSCVRLGNVLNSSGSVIPTFVEQIKRGGPVTITSQDMVRFFTSLPNAVNMILSSTQKTTGGEIFVFKMKALKVMDLAEVLIERLAAKHGHKPKDIETKIIGMRPGERSYELLMSEEEARHARDDGALFVIRPGLFAPHVIKPSINQNTIDSAHYDARKAKLLTKSEIEKLLLDEKLI